MSGGGRFKTSSLLGFDFLLLCKHCREVFSNYKELKIHLKQIHQIKSSSMKKTTKTAKDQSDKGNQSDHLRGKVQSDWLNGKVQSDHLNGKVQSDLLNGKDQSDHPPIPKNIDQELVQSEVLNDHQSLQKSVSPEKRREQRKRQKKNNPDFVYYTKRTRTTRANKNKTFLSVKPHPQQDDSTHQLKNKLNPFIQRQSLSLPVDNEESSSTSTNVGLNGEGDELLDNESELLNKKISYTQIINNNGKTYSAKQYESNKNHYPHNSIKDKMNKNLNSETLWTSKNGEQFTFPSSLSVIPTSSLETTLEIDLTSPSSSSSSSSSPPLDVNINLDVLNKNSNSISTTIESNSLTNDSISNSNNNIDDDDDYDNEYDDEPEPESILTSNDIVNINTSSTPRPGFRLCTECPRYIKYRSKGKKIEYIEHLQIHSGELTFVCPWKNCLRGFMNPIQLLSHSSKMHTGTKSFECETCSTSFVSFIALCTHQRFSYQCKIRDAIRT